MLDARTGYSSQQLKSPKKALGISHLVYDLIRHERCKSTVCQMRAYKTNQVVATKGQNIQK